MKGDGADGANAVFVMGNCTHEPCMLGAAAGANNMAKGWELVRRPAIIVFHTSTKPRPPRPLPLA